MSFRSENGEVTAIDVLLTANRDFAAGFEPAAAATPQVALVLCMDARIDPIRALGIPPGHAHIIRNAGGRLVDAIRSLIVSQHVIGTVEVAIVHHTECGLATLHEAELRSGLEQKLGTSAGDIEFHSFTDLEGSVRDDLALYRQTPFLRQDIPVRGFIYDVTTGLLSEVDAP